MAKESEKNLKVQPSMKVKSGVQAGYWTCSGVTGPTNKKGVIKPAYASYCWK